MIRGRGYQMTVSEIGEPLERRDYSAHIPSLTVGVGGFPVWYSQRCTPPRSTRWHVFAWSQVGQYP